MSPGISSAALGIEGLIRQALGPRIKLEIVPPTAPNCIEVDRSQLELAILNIALNARDAMPRGGTLTVTISTADLVGEPDGLIGNYAAIAIKDTNLGMAPNVQAHVLEPFFTTKGPGKGTGLGLSMVHGFCRQSKGAVTIRSAVGSDTTIVIYLPLSRERDDERAVQQSREFDR